MSPPIYRLWNFGFGDHWQTLAYLSHLGEATGKPVHLSTMQHGTNYNDRLIEMLCELPVSRNLVLSSAEPTHELNGFDIWACPPLRTRLRWGFQPLRHKTVVYQFDGFSSPDKNPPPEDQIKIIHYLLKRGYEAVKVGKHMTIQQCVRACADAALFVGVSSGMQCLAQSVGVPVYLLEYALPVITCTRQKQFVLCKGAAHFEAEVQGYLTLIDNLRLGVPSPR